MSDVTPQVDFGGRLRTAREARGISLRDIAATTKISMTALEGLEHGDASRLPGGIFSRSFVRAYAAEVGLDPDATVREFLQRFPDSVQPLQASMVQAPAGVPARRGWLRVSVATVVLLGAAGTGLALSGWVRLPTPVPDAEAPPPVAGAPPAMSTPVPAGAPTAAEVVASLEPPADVLPASSAGPSPAQAQGVTTALAVPDPVSGGLRLAMEAVAPCWVKVVADGAVVFARQMNAGDREVRQADGEIVLTVGDAGVFHYSINDVRGRPLGSRGKVVTIRIHRENLTDFIAD